MNRRVTIAQIIQLDNKQKFKPVKNFLIDFYLDGFKSRRQKNQKKLNRLFNYLTLCCLITTLVINIAIPVIKPSRLWKHILFDLSVLFKGIEMYNRIIVILGMIFGIVLNVELRISNYDESIELLRMFEICRSKVRQVFMSRDPESNQILNRLVRVTEVFYKIITILFILGGKF